jgi:hypothetical protein
MDRALTMSNRRRRLLGVSSIVAVALLTLPAASRSDGPAGAANGVSYDPTISTGGRYVAFSSDASNLVAGDSNHARDVFVYDRVAQTLERISVSSAGVQGNNDSGVGGITTVGARSRSLRTVASSLSSHLPRILSPTTRTERRSRLVDAAMSLSATVRRRRPNASTSAVRGGRR